MVAASDTVSAIGVGDLVVALVTRESHSGCRSTEAGQIYRCRALLDLRGPSLFSRFTVYQCSNCGVGDQIGVSLEGDPGADELFTGRAFWCSHCELRPVSGDERNRIEKLCKLDQPPAGFEEPKRASPARVKEKELK